MTWNRWKGSGRRKALLWSLLCDNRLSIRLVLKRLAGAIVTVVCDFFMVKGKMRFICENNWRWRPFIGASSESRKFAWGCNAILSKMLLLTRLATRTKESNTYASLRVQKPIGVMKVSIRCESQDSAPTNLDLLRRVCVRAYLLVQTICTMSPKTFLPFWCGQLNLKWWIASIPVLWVCYFSVCSVFCCIWPINASGHRLKIATLLNAARRDFSRFEKVTN